VLSGRLSWQSSGGTLWFCSSRPSLSGTDFAQSAFFSMGSSYSSSEDRVVVVIEDNKSQISTNVSKGGPVARLN
jgi:hypothetical protein